MGESAFYGKRGGWVTDNEKGQTTDGGKIRHPNDHYLLFHPYAPAERADPDVTATHVISSF